MRLLKLLLICMCLSMCFGCDAINTFINKAAVVTPNPWRGTNMAGGELTYGSSNTTNPVNGTDYQFPTTQDVDYVSGKGMGFIRLTFSWEAMQSQLNGTLTPTVATSGWTTGLTTYSATFQNIVNYATNTKGMTVLVEPHGGSSGNFWHYRGNAVGSSAVPDSAFANFWGQMATLYKGNSRVALGLGNEPNGFSTATLTSAEQAAITAIRSSGFAGKIFVPGNCWTSADSYTVASCDAGNPKIASSTAFLTLKDPNNNLVASIHEYFDTQDGGLDTSIVNANIGVTRLAATLSWANANGVKLHISEFAVAASNSLATQTLTNFYATINANPNILGGSWWVEGPWFGSYMFTLTPSSNYTKDSAQMALVLPFITSGTNTAPSSTPTVTATTSPSSTGTTTATGTTTSPSATVTSTATSTGSAPSSTATSTSSSPPVVDSGAPAPTTIPMTVGAAQIIESSGLNYCEQFTISNPNKTAQTWSSFQVNFRDGQLAMNGSSPNIWNITLKGTAKTGVVTFNSVVGNGKSIPANGSWTVGFCAVENSDTKFHGTYVANSLVQP